MSIMMFLGLMVTALTVLFGILLVLFGQITVRKLRKNPATRDHLGVELMSGWDIFNTAWALSKPKSWLKVSEEGPFSFMHAKSSLLYQHTTRFDRILARTFTCLHLLLGWTVFMLGILGFLGYKM